MNALISEAEVTSLDKVGLEFEKEVWQALAEGGCTPIAKSAVPPYDILVDTDPRIYVVCKAIAGPRGWFEAIGRACYRMHCDPDSYTILAVPYVGGFYERISYFFKKNDLIVDTPNTLARTIAELTRSSRRGCTPDVDSGSDGDDVQF